MSIARDGAMAEGITGPQLQLVEFNRIGEVSRRSPNTYILMPAGCLNIFGQQRAGRNEQQNALTDSLEEGQIHPISVVMASPELIEEYRQFTNRAWKKDVQPSDFRPMPGADPLYPGMYAILCAGHSRTDGIRELAARAGENPDHALVEARIFEEHTVEGILSLQVRENIHSQPGPDRALRAVAELYLFETERNHGVAPSITAFRRRRKVPAQVMSDALNYVLLPPYIRELTDDGSLPFGIIKELARARPAIVSYATYLADRDPRFEAPPDTPASVRRERTAAKDAAVDLQIRTELFTLLNGVHERGAGAGKNILASRNFIKGRARMMRDHVAQRRAAELEMRFELFEDPETLQGRFDQLQKDIKEYLGRILSEQQQRKDHLARRLARLTEVGAEENAPDGVVTAIEAALELARLAVSETT